MKRIIILFVNVAISMLGYSQNGRIGINTTTPAAILHVKDSSVLFSGSSTSPSGGFGAPASGQGVRMMWLPAKAAFRAGYVNGTIWDTDSIGSFSFATGFNTKAKGLYSVSLGQANTASGFVSTALGRATQASGSSSIAMGENTIAAGDNSTAIGYTTDATGDYSIAMGYGANASGRISMAMGFGTEAEGEYSLAMGQLTDAIGENSVSMGDHTSAVGISSVAMGDDARATGAITTAMGLSTQARSYASLVIGRFNDSIISSSPTSWVATDPVFIIGNGTSTNARSNALTVLKNAKTGINTETPQAGLHIKAVDGTFDQHIRLESTLGSSSYATILYDGSLKCRVFESGATFQWRDFGSDTRMTLTSAGNLSIDGTLSQGSDVRLKKNITPLKQSLQKILSLSGYQYNWIDLNRDTLLQAGVLAQEVEKQMPELVTTDTEGMKAVNYSGMIPYLIESIKELKKENEEMKKEILLLKKTRN
jgi:hypothetical protein